MKFKTKFKLLFPHGLTSIRIILSPFLVLSGLMGNKSIFLILLIISIISDFLDDYFARKWYVKTDFSTKLDMVGDKVFEIGTCIGLTHFYSLPIFLLILDILLIFINIYRFQKDFSFEKSLLGSYKTIILWITLSLASIHLIIPKFIFLINGLFAVSINLMIIYLIKQITLLKKDLDDSSLTPLERNKIHQKIMKEIENTKEIKNLKHFNH